MGGCYKPTTYPYWKEPEDVINRISTRQKLKQRSLITQSYIAEYYGLLKKGWRNILMTLLRLMLKLIQTIQTHTIQTQTE